MSAVHLPMLSRLEGEQAIASSPVSPRRLLDNRVTPPLLLLLNIMAEAAHGADHLDIKLWSQVCSFAPRKVAATFACSHAYVVVSFFFPLGSGGGVWVECGERGHHDCAVQLSHSTKCRTEAKWISGCGRHGSIFSEDICASPGSDLAASPRLTHAGEANDQDDQGLRPCGPAHLIRYVTHLHPCRSSLHTRRR